MAWYQYSVDSFTKEVTGSGSSAGVVKHTFEVITEIEPKSNTEAQVRFKLRNAGAYMSGCIYVFPLTPPNSAPYFVNLKPSGYSWGATGTIIDLGSNTSVFTITKKASDKFFDMFPCDIYLAPESRAISNKANWEAIRTTHESEPNSDYRGKWTLFGTTNRDLLPDTFDNTATGWADISGTTVTYKDTVKKNNSSSHNKVQVTVQYKPTSADPESVDVRFKLEKVSSTDHTNYSDAMYILYNGNGVGGKITTEPTLIPLKGYGQSNDDWIFYSDPITIGKKYSDTTFRLQEFHICNHQYYSNYQYKVSVDNFITLYYGDAATRKAYRTAVDAQNISIPNTVAKDITCDTPYILDNGNNTFSIVVKNLFAGTLNPINNIQLTYKRVTDPMPVTVTSIVQNKNEQTLGPYNILIDTTNKDAINYLTEPAQMVSITLDITGTYNGFYFSTSAAINCYAYPIMEDTPRVSMKSWSDCRYYWNQVFGSNSNSPLKGYLISLGKVDDIGDVSELLSLNYSNNKICYGERSNITQLAFESAGQEAYKPQYTIYEMNLEEPIVDVDVNSFITAGVVVPGDRLALTVIPYSKPTTAINILYGPMVIGDILEIQEEPQAPPKAKGTLKVFTKEHSWETGQVYVKVNSTTWVAAEAVYVYTDNGWKISE